MKGLLIAFEGLDQSGKQTQGELLREWLTSRRREVKLMSFPDYDTPIGAEIRRALRGERHYGADVMQLLYVANRYERKEEIANGTRSGNHGRLRPVSRFECRVRRGAGARRPMAAKHSEVPPQPDVTILLDMPPEVSARRKQSDRDKYERDLALLGRVRRSYLRQAEEQRWLRLDADRDRDVVAADIYAAIAPRMD